MRALNRTRGFFSVCSWWKPFTSTSGTSRNDYQTIVLNYKADDVENGQNFRKDRTWKPKHRKHLLPFFKTSKTSTQSLSRSNENVETKR